MGATTFIDFDGLLGNVGNISSLNVSPVEATPVLVAVAVEVALKVVVVAIDVAVAAVVVVVVVAVVKVVVIVMCSSEKEDASRFAGYFKCNEAFS